MRKATSSFLLLAMMIFFCAGGRAAEIEVSAKIGRNEGNEGKEWMVTATLRNTSGGTIFLPQREGKWIELRLDLWSLGKGVELYDGQDAEWRREGAFSPIRWEPLEAGKSIAVSFSLMKLKPGHPELDNLAAEILNSVNFLEVARAYVEVMYLTKDQDYDPTKREYVAVKMEK